MCEIPLTQDDIKNSIKIVKETAQLISDKQFQPNRAYKCSFCRYLEHCAVFDVNNGKQQNSILNRY